MYENSRCFWLPEAQGCVESNENMCLKERLGTGQGSYWLTGSEASLCRDCPTIEGF